MKLEMATFPVKDVKFSKQTNYDNGVLNINKEELVAFILEDKRIVDADVDVAFPGEQTRIVRIRDVVEPRVKVSGPGSVFPGILGPVITVGEGRTHRFSGVTVMPSVDYQPTIMHGTTAQAMGIVDMWGPGAQATPYGSTINIVPVFKLIDGISEVEAEAAIKLAECKLAQRLAEATRNITTESIDVYELSEVDSSLPRVVYVLSFLTLWSGLTSYVYFYGWPLHESLPTLVHPNEIFDGAMTTDGRQGGGTRTMTWMWQNQPVIKELFREHGKRLNFLGVILQRTFFTEEHGAHLTAEATSQMAKLLGAEGAIITQSSPSGANWLNLVLTLQAFEKKGIKTAIATPEWGGNYGTETPLQMYVPEATAMVSTGAHDHAIELPAPAKVIGGKYSQLVQLYSEEWINPRGELTLSRVDLTTGSDYFGNMSLSCREY